MIWTDATVGADVRMTHGPHAVPRHRVDLVFRVAASGTLGAGHVMRCSALAEHWVGGRVGRAIFWGEVSLGFARKRIEAVGGQIVDRYLRNDTSAILVCDHYDPQVRATAARYGTFGLRVLVDDLGGAVEPGFDVVWNPNAYGSPQLYPGFAGQVLSGPGQIPIRSGLPRWVPRGSASTAVMLGGSRVDAGIAEAFRRLPDRTPDVRFVGTGSWVPSTWSAIDARDPWPEIAGCDRLITSSGTTVWEAANVGIPALLLRIDPNQSLIFDWARGSGVPGVDALAFTGDPDGLAGALAAAVGKARPLPQIENGAHTIADRLRELALAMAC